MERSQLRWIISSASVIFVSLAVQFYVTHCGLFLTHDSFEYLSAADSFRDDQTFKGTDGRPYVFWPPLFPIVLSLFQEPAKAMVWINLFLTGMIGIMISRLASGHLTDFRFRLGFLVACMLGVHQLLISVFLWSELTFLLLLLVFVDHVNRSTTSRMALAIAFGSGLLLCLQRNAGLFIVPAAVIYFFAAKDDQHRSSRAALIVLLSTAGGIWWNALNMFGSIKTQISDLDYFSSILENLFVVADGVAKSILPFTVFSIPFAVMIVISPIALIWPSRKLSDHFLLMAMICCFYLAGMAVLFKLDPNDADRYAAVVLPYLLLILFKVFENFYKKTSKMIRAILLAGMIAWLCYPLLRTVRNAIQWHDISCANSGERK